MECLKCGSKNILVEESRAEIICEDCGVIGELFNGRRDTEFEEMENGRVVAVGNVVCTGQYASKQATIKRANSKICDLCSKLSLTGCTAEYATNIFKTALSDGITRGRNALVTIGACVYLAARVNHQSLMLLDISDKVGVNVYTLGKFYKELKEKTGQKVSDIDPALFIGRFAMDLELGDKTDVVMTTALKILQRMKKDWISTGRRPNGITATALLISARLHGFDRNADDLAKIAGISKSTTNKRLQEWAQTSTSDLTMKQFCSIEYEDEFDPPSFINQKEVKVIDEMSTEDFELLKKKVIAMLEQLDDKGDKLKTVDYEKLVENIESGECDVEELIGALESDNEDDKEIEFEGRIGLFESCSGLTDALTYLKKKEVKVNMKNTEGQLPFYLDNNECEGKWPPNGEVFEDEEEIDDEELERVYICSNEEAVMKLKWWVKNNKDYYKKIKKSQEKRLFLKKQEEEKGKKKIIRGSRQKRDSKFAVDKEELLRDIHKASPEYANSPPMKKQCMTNDDEDQDQYNDNQDLNTKFEHHIEDNESDKGIPSDDEVVFDYCE